MIFKVPIQSSGGRQYLLNFTENKSLPIKLDVDVVSMTLSLVSETTTAINNMDVLNKITTIVFNVLDDNDVISYFYCSKDPINQRQNRQMMSPQEYRSHLFSTMFDKISDKHKPGTFINKTIILRDETEGDHYIHLIVRSKYKDKIDEFAQSIEVFFNREASIMNT